MIHIQSVEQKLSQVIDPNKVGMGNLGAQCKTGMASVVGTVQAYLAFHT